MRTAGIFAAIALSLVSLRAHADSKAWTAARAGLPADTKLVIGLDVAALQKTELFAAYYPKLLEKAEAAKVIDTMKTSCKLDPLTAIQGIVVATAADQGEGAAYIAFAGVDKAKLSSCLQLAVQSAAKDAKDPKDAAVSIKHDGNITQVTRGATTTYVGWVGKDVLVVPFKAEDKQALVKWMGGKGAFARSDLGKSLARVKTSAALWGAGEATKELQPGMTATGGYGAVTFSKGNLDADVHAVMQTAAQATTMATEAKKQIDQARQGGMMPPAISGLLKAVTISAANDEVIVKANIAEKDLVGALALALGGMGGP
jgi:hypothetical protein